MEVSLDTIGKVDGIVRDKDNEIEWKTPYRKLLESECKRYTKQMALALDYSNNFEM